MEFLCLAQCEGLGGAYARKAGLLFPGACFLKKKRQEEDLLKQHWRLSSLGPSLAQSTHLNSGYLLPWAALPARWGLSDLVICGVSQGVI